MRIWQVSMSIVYSELHLRSSLMFVDSWSVRALNLQRTGMHIDRHVGQKKRGFCLSLVIDFLRIQTCHRISCNTIQVLLQFYMEDPPYCTGRLCKLCHRDFKAKIERRAGKVPCFAKPTKATIRREIATRLASPRKLAPRPAVSRTKVGFEDLPVEIRLQVYRSCLRSDPGTLLMGWVKGGGLHADAQMPVYERRLYIRPSHAFPRQVLQLNRRIHGEARREIYKNISFNFMISWLEPQLPQIRYWLTQHPLRFAKQIELGASIIVSSSPYRAALWEAPTKQMEALGGVFAKASHIRQLKLLVFLDLQAAPRDHEAVDRELIRAKSWKNKLIVLTNLLVPTCKASLSIQAGPARGIGALNTLKLEKRLVEAAAASFPGLEVRQITMDEPRLSKLPSTGLCIQHVRVL